MTMIDHHSDERSPARCFRCGLEWPCDAVRLTADLVAARAVVEAARELDPLKYEHQAIAAALLALDGPCKQAEGHMGWLECRTHSAPIRARLDAQAAGAGPIPTRMGPSMPVPHDHIRINGCYRCAPAPPTPQGETEK